MPEFLVEKFIILLYDGYNKIRSVAPPLASGGVNITVVRVRLPAKNFRRIV